MGTAAYAIAFGVRWWESTFFFVVFGLMSLSVTAGYHRRFAHKTYLSHPALQFHISTRAEQTIGNG